MYYMYLYVHNKEIICEIIINRKGYSFTVHFTNWLKENTEVFYTVTSKNK